MSNNLWVIVPAAGIGRRMAGELPKQYMPLAGRTVIECAVDPFVTRVDVSGIVIVHARDDDRVRTLSMANDPRVRFAFGGAERADSVLCGLRALVAPDHDWVLVHDAARPCLHATDLAHLIDEVSGDDVGGLLAVALADTLKSSNPAQRVQATVSREGLWRALTPQMFRYGLLRRALQSAAEAKAVVTDEATAIERLGLQPKLVVGRADNIKITVPEDLVHAEFILRTRMQQR